MSRWVDVSESEWFFNEIMEASNIVLEDGEPLVTGIPYSSFIDGAPYLYEEQKGATGKTVFHLDVYVVPTAANPLYVYIDGVQTIYKEWSINAGKTDVELYVPAASTSVISFVSIGKPEVDSFGKPNLQTNYSYPQKVLDNPYYYDPFNRKYQEYCYAFGRALKRAQVPVDAEDTMTSAQIATKYIGDKQDTYWIDSTGLIFLPYNLDGVTCQLQYTSIDEDNNVTLKGGNFHCAAPTGNVRYNNRFFPSAMITRQEAFSLIDRLRKTFYSRFTDLDAPEANFYQEEISYYGQKVFKLKGRVSGGTSLLIVRVDGATQTLGTHYTKFDDHTVLFIAPLPENKLVTFTVNKTESSRFADVGDVGKMRKPDATVVEYSSSYSVWWAKNVMDMEDERISDGTHLIEGITTTKFFDGAVAVDNMNNPIGGSDPAQTWFMPQTPMTRAQTVAFLNRFRKWAVDIFKR
jgi:hypothetical protein